MISYRFQKLLDEANRGVADSQVLVGLAYEEGDEEMNVSVDYEKAFFWYFRAAIHNNVHAQYYLAAMYEDGKYVQQDYLKALLGMRKRQNKDMQWHKPIWDCCMRKATG